MFSTRTPTFLRLDLILLSLFAVLSLTPSYWISSTASLITYPEHANAEAASTLAFAFPQTDSHPSWASVIEKVDIPPDVLSVRNVAEPPPSNDSNNDTEHPDSSLTDSGASPPRMSRVTIAFIVFSVGLCLLSIYYRITHPTRSHLFDDHIKPTISHISDRLPTSILLISQRLVDISHRLSAHLPSVNSPSSPLITAFVGKFHRKSRRRPRNTPHSFRVGEGRLVEWAQEDMGMLDLDSEATDFMVNAEDPNESEDLVDEYIPLSVGMGWKAKTKTAKGGPLLPVRNYGSATGW
ncbi:hypothetical protein F5880DRAFT_1505780 [Lentinula raphanica]|nr:hypothetical protein F5880DRAFT_1505780 [Lentinula raphanica]